VSGTESGLEIGAARAVDLGRYRGSSPMLIRPPLFAIDLRVAG
jgi:hypothetical protein